MMTATIKLSAAVYFAAGEYLNGVTLTEAQWLRSGTAEVSAEKAEALERNGYADILLRDGKPYMWAACCDKAGEHDHG